MNKYSPIAELADCLPRSANVGAKPRRGLSLLELLAMVGIAAVLFGVAAARFTPSALWNFGSRSAARQLAVDLLQAQRRSISTGDNHYLQFIADGSGVRGYQLYRRTSGGSSAVEPKVDFAVGLTAAVSHTTAEFTFEGTALAAYQITLSGPDRTWRVNVTPVTGSVQVEQL